MRGGANETSRRCRPSSVSGLVVRHHAIVRESLGRWRGVENDTAGDGFFATFDGPARRSSPRKQPRKKPRFPGLSSGRGPRLAGHAVTVAAMSRKSGPSKQAVPRPPCCSRCRAEDSHDHQTREPFGHAHQHLLHRLISAIRSGLPLSRTATGDLLSRRRQRHVARGQDGVPNHAR